LSKQLFHDKNLKKFTLRWYLESYYTVELFGSDFGLEITQGSKFI